jgi:LmbE family N-acetylglucosaminyl deacetylase
MNGEPRKRQDAGVLAAFEQELVRAHVWRRVVERPAGARALFIAAHADDVEIGCGGTVLKLLEAEVAVRQVVLTDGRLAAPDPAGQEAMAKTRLEEARSVAAHLMLPPPDWFGVPEGQLAQPQREAELIERLAALLADSRPEMVFVPYFFDQHPDHRYANHLLAAALPRCGLALPALTVHAYEAWSYVPPWLVVDVSAQLAEKKHLVSLYRSQLKLLPYLELIDRMTAPRTSLAGPGVTAVEAFCPFRGDEYVERAAGLDLASAQSLALNVNVAPPPVDQRP